MAVTEIVGQQGRQGDVVTCGSYYGGGIRRIRTASWLWARAPAFLTGADHVAARQHGGWSGKLAAAHALEVL